MCTTQGSLSTGCLASDSVVLMLRVVLAESGEAPGVDVTHKEVKRDTAGRRPGDRNTTQSTAKLTHLHSYTPPEVTQLAGTKTPTIKAAEWH